MVSRDDDAVERRQATRAGFLPPGLGGGTDTSTSTGAAKKKAKKKEPRKKQKLLVKIKPKDDGYNESVSDAYNQNPNASGPSLGQGSGIDPAHGYGSPYASGQLKTGVGQNMANNNPRALFQHHLAQAGLPTHAKTPFGQFLDNDYLQRYKDFEAIKTTTNQNLTFDRYLQGLGGGIAPEDYEAPVTRRLDRTHKMNPNLKPIKDSIPKNLKGKARQKAIKAEKERRREARRTINTKPGTETISMNFGKVGQNFDELQRRAFLSQAPMLRGSRANDFGAGSTVWAAYR